MNKNIIYISIGALLLIGGVAATYYLINRNKGESFGGGRGGRGGGGRGGGRGGRGGPGRGGRGWGRGGRGWGGRGWGGGNWAGWNPVYYVDSPSFYDYDDDPCNCFAKYKSNLDKGMNKDKVEEKHLECLEATAKGFCL